jgi:hypothetical protein
MKEDRPGNEGHVSKENYDRIKVRHEGRHIDQCDNLLFKEI